MYLSNHEYIEYVLDKTGLSLKELELVVGRFNKNHHTWAGKLKGEYLETLDGTKIIRHHFTKKILWREK